MIRSIAYALAALFVLAGLSTSALASGGGGEAEAGTGPAFVQVAPFSAPVFRDGRVWGTMTLVIKLDVAEGVSLAEIDHEMPRFQAETLNFLIRYGSSGQVGKALMNLDFLMKQLQSVADQLFHPGHVKLLVHAASQERKR
jgi:hypothetical protein